MCCKQFPRSKVFLDQNTDSLADRNRAQKSWLFCRTALEPHVKYDRFYNTKTFKLTCKPNI